MYRTAFLGFSLLTVIGCGQQPAQIDTAQCTGSSVYLGAPLRESLSFDVPSTRAFVDRPFDPQITTRLNAALLRASTASGASAIQAVVLQSDAGSWEGRVGVSSDGLSPLGSIAKLAIAQSILKFQDQGDLSVNDTVSSYVADVPAGDLITLRMLLTHTSGIADRRNGAYALQGCPGEEWRYSNEGYNLLGQVISSVTDKPFQAAVNETVLADMGPDALRFVGPADTLAGIAPPERSASGQVFDVRDANAAGALVGTPAAAAEFLVSVLMDRGPRLDRLYPMDQQGLWYGQGVMVYDVPGACGTNVWIGHSGSVPGARAIVAYAPSFNAIVAVTLQGNGSVESVANLLFEALAAPN